ncbi:MAG: VWA domain-containing protein [Bacteroidaceae bacterium]
MFRFENPQYLYLLFIVPIFILLWLWMQLIRRKMLRRMGDVGLLKQLMPTVSVARPIIKFALLLSAFSLLICILARPQFGIKVDTHNRKGIEAIIALDVSNSMLAEDVSPNRLERAKMLLSNLIDKMENDKVGLVVFAGESFTQLPITSDYISAKMFLESISPDMIKSQGTDIAGAITQATNSFTQQEGIGRAIIIITDGENHEGGIETAAAAAAKKGIKLFVLGVGEAEGAPIPVGRGYLKDNAGNTVITYLNEDMCKEVAQAGRGSYIHVDNSQQSQDQLTSELHKLTKKDVQSTVYSEYDEQFQAVAIIALILLILEIMILERKSPILRKLKLFKR